MVFMILLSDGLLLVHRVTVGFYINLDLSVAELITEGFFLFFREFLGISLCTGGYHLQIEAVYSPAPSGCLVFLFLFALLPWPIPLVEEPRVGVLVSFYRNPLLKRACCVAGLECAGGRLQNCISALGEYNIY